MNSSFPHKLLAVCLGLLAGGRASGADDVVIRWNDFLREAMKRDSLYSNPGHSTRAMAMMNGAIYDSFQAVRRTHAPFHVNMSASPTANLTAAVAAAAYPIAKDHYPAETYFLTWCYRNYVDQIPESADKAAGIALGEAVAAAYLAWRLDDGHDSLVEYVPGNGPGKWQPDPDFFPVQTAWGPEWGAVRPFVVASSSQFQPPPPPALDSAAYAAAFAEVKAYGADDSEVRTADQFQVGQFWAYDRSGMGPPPVMYNKSLSEICKQRGTPAAVNARVFAMVSAAMADASICAWDAKFESDFWRPVTAIRAADTDGNPATEANPEWHPLGVPGGGIFPNFTPAFPSYVSGHAAMGGAAFQMMKRFFGSDRQVFALGSEEVPGVTRHYTTFSQAARENADSRVWLGVHWRFDQTEGQNLGEAVADFVAANAFAPVLETYADFAGVHGTSLDGSGDLDHDGLSDFAEYAFGLHPRTADAPAGAELRMIGNVQYLVLPYSRQPARMAAGLSVSAEVSAAGALSGWTTVGITDMADPTKTSTSGMEYRCACVPVVPGAAVFMRLRAGM
ncbi:MAG: hypothetical protein JWL81_3212 [Verrucomicrobiales bacterium]|nr:hypothetical protein [Verrucomicrobiales bacterium]